MKYDYEGKDALRKLFYPPISATGAVNIQNVQSVKIIYTLPKYIFIHPDDKPRVAIFDVFYSSKKWYYYQ